MTRKELELALARERAERDEREKASLAALKMQLEQEECKIEEELTQESATLQPGLDTLESQLDRAMATQHSGKEKYRILKEAFDEAANHLSRLESAEKTWIEKENALFGEKTERETEFGAARAKCEQLEKEVTDAKLALGEKAEDIARIKKRVGATISEPEPS